jgi:hypothetical protein
VLAELFLERLASDGPHQEDLFRIGTRTQLTHDIG